MKTKIKALLFIAGLMSLAPTASATGIPVYDAGNYIENLFTKLEAMQQTKYQYDIKNDGTKTKDNTTDMLGLDKILTAATGSVQGRTNFQSQFTSKLSAIPSRMNGTFGGILGYGGGEQRWGKNNPVGDSMGTMLDNMMGRGQRQAEQVNQGLSGGMFDSSKAASALSQMTASQSLLTEKDKAETLKELSKQAGEAEDQQTGQVVQTQAMLEGVAAQNEANTLMAADNLSRQEAAAEKRRTLRNRAAGSAISNSESYFGN